MACTSEFIEYICTTLAPLGDIKSRKMMGDYVVYVDGKCVITACDNNAFVKKLPAIAELMADAEVAAPYPGAKEAYILDMSDTNKTLQVIAILRDTLPYPKVRAKKK